MNLRKLEMKDAPFMLEWMHDENVTSELQKNFAVKTLSDCEKFIDICQNDKNNLHLAIADENDTYMGTVSLKNIIDGSAEFAITIRTKAMGKGYSKYAMAKIIEIGFNNYRLKKIYWYVSKNNLRAIRFYDKNGYKKVQCLDRIKCNINGQLYSQNYDKKYIYYQILNE